MPKKQLTVEERKLQNIKNAFRLYREAVNEVYDYTNNVKLTHEEFEDNTNLEYYRQNGAKGYEEKEEYSKLVFQDDYYRDLIQKMEDFTNSYDKVNDCYNKTLALQQERIRLDKALEDQKQLTESAKAVGAEPDFEPISLDVEGLQESKTEFNKFINDSKKMFDEINNLRKEETFNAKTQEFLDEYRKTHKNDEPVKEEPKEEKKEEVKEEPKVSEEEIKRKELLSKIDSFELKIRTNTLDTDKAKKEFDDFFNEVAGKEFNDETKKYDIPGVKDKLNLKETMEAYRTTILFREDNQINNARNSRITKDTPIVDEYLQKGIDDVNRILPDVKKISDRLDSFDNLRDHYNNEIDPTHDNHADPSKYAQLVGLTNRLAQIHHQHAKPGFFSRLFNTKYNKDYNAEQGKLDYYKDMLKGAYKIDDELLNKITDKKTCYDPVEKEELLGDYYLNQYKKIDGDNPMFKDVTDRIDIVEGLTKTAAMKDIVNGKSPVDTFSDYFEKSKDEGPIVNKDRTLSEEKDNNRVKIEIEELAPEKQQLDNERVQEKEVQPSLDGPTNSK